MTAAIRVCCPKCKNFTALDQLGSISGHHDRPGRPTWCTAAGLTLEEARGWVAGKLNKANVRALLRYRGRLTAS